LYTAIVVCPDHFSPTPTSSGMETPQPQSLFFTIPGRN